MGISESKLTFHKKKKLRISIYDWLKCEKSSVWGFSHRNRRRVVIEFYYLNGIFSIARKTQMCTFFSICIVNWLVKKCVCVLTGHNYEYNIAIKSVKCRTTIVCSIGLITRNGIRVYIPKNERSKEKIPLCIYCYSIYGKQKVIVCPDGISFMLRTSTSICLDCCQNTHGIHLREWEKNMYTRIYGKDKIQEATVLHE